MRSRLTGSQSRKFIERKKTRAIVAVVLTALSIGCWLFVLSKMSYLGALSINSVNVIGADLDIVPAIRAAVYDSIQGSYLGLFSKSNTLIYPHVAITEVLQKTSPRVNSISVSRDGLTGLNISVIEKVPAAIVCSNLPDFSDSNVLQTAADDCYHADASGYIFAKDPLTIENLNRYYFPSLTDTSSSTDIIGSFATSSQEFIALQKFYSDSEKSGIVPSAILAKDGGEYEMYADNTVIYFNDSQPFGDELANLVAFWNRMKTESKQAGKPFAFEYIDIRYGSNVFYREMQ